METTGDEVRETFLVTPKARSLYSGWENDAERVEHGVITTVENHTTRAIYRNSSETFDWIKKHHTHPLGDIKKNEIEHIKLAENWYPQYAFVHLFHFLMERLGRPPLWSEFDTFFYGEECGRRMFGKEREELEEEIYESELRSLLAKHGRREGIENRARYLAAGSVDWRIGNGYYGFMRDMYTAVQLRKRGLDARVHPVADALFRADAWVDRSILSIFVINPKYKTADRRRARKVQAERKIKVEEIYPDGEFNFVALTLEAAEEHGKFHFPTEPELDRAEQQIREQNRI